MHTDFDQKYIHTGRRRYSFLLTNLFSVKEIILIDDYSTDGSRELIENKLKLQVDKIILNEKNFGKGYSVRKGIKAAEGNIILIQDADLEYSPSDYDKLINPINQLITPVNKSYNKCRQ